MRYRHYFQIRINGNSSEFGGAICIYAEEEADLNKTLDSFCDKHNFKRDILVFINKKPALKEEIERVNNNTRDLEDKNEGRERIRG